MTPRTRASACASLAFCLACAAGCSTAPTSAAGGSVDSGPRDGSAGYSSAPLPEAASPMGSSVAESGAPADAGPAPLDATTPPSEASVPPEPSEAGTAEAGDAAVIKYDEDGPIAYSMTTAMVQNGADSFVENIYLPSSSASAAMPLVSLTPGLQQTSAAYAPYAERLASYGIIVLMRDDPGLLVQSQVIAADLGYTVGTWLPAQNGDASSPLYGKVDLTKVGLTGHSRGGQASLLAIEGSLLGHVVAWFGIDPDDPGTIDGFTESTMTAAGTLGTIGIPTTFLGGQVTTFCTPANINYQVLYAAAPSPSVEITGVNASHTEFEVQSACVDCALCVPMGTASPQVVLGYAVRYLTAFFARELLGDASVGATFLGVGAGADEAAGLIQLTSK